MSTFLNPQLPAWRQIQALARVMFVVVLFLGASTAHADNIYTYNIVDYPSAEQPIAPYTFVQISGTITLDAGDITLGDTPVNTNGMPSIIADISINTNLWTEHLITAPYTALNVMATSSEFYLDGTILSPNSNEFALAGNWGPPGLNSGQFNGIVWQANGYAGAYYAFDYTSPDANELFDAETWQGGGGVSCPLIVAGPSIPGIQLGVAPMIIADDGQLVSTPEPGTLTLLVSALLGLGVVYLRRRGAKV